MTLPEGYAFEIYNTRQPFDTTRYAMKWDGEWHITYEVFRDLGLAFAAVLVLIYILVVWWFQSFDVPLTIMAAIPFSLVGILPAHAAMGAFFTATSMIGFIAGAGIVVRNSIILVDFIELRLREGMPLAEAVVDAGAVRFRPMALTAAAVIVGSAVILFDPIFQGLAISLMAGEVASLLLSRVTVPVLVFHESPEAAHPGRGRCAIAGRSAVMSPAANISRVLVGVDFDDASASALRMAGVLASPWNADITVFHSSTPEAPVYFTAAQIETLEAEREQSRAATTAQLRLFAAQHVRRAVNVVVDEGPPEDALVRMAADFDLIVVGTHRRHGVRRWWLGSVAEAVVRRSSRPVLVVPAGAGVPEARRPTILAAGGNVAAVIRGSMCSGSPSAAMWFARRISITVLRIISRAPI